MSKEKDVYEKLIRNLRMAVVNISIGERENDPQATVDGYGELAEIKDKLLVAAKAYKDGPSFPELMEQIKAIFFRVKLEKVFDTNFSNEEVLEVKLAELLKPEAAQYQAILTRAKKVVSDFNEKHDTTFVVTPKLEIEKDKSSNPERVRTAVKTLFVAHRQQGKPLITFSVSVKEIGKLLGKVLSNKDTSLVFREGDSLLPYELAMQRADPETIRTLVQKNLLDSLDVAAAFKAGLLGEEEIKIAREGGLLLVGDILAPTKI